jgi:hypothetical protein
MSEDREAQIQERIERLDRETQGRSIEGSLADEICTSQLPLPNGGGVVEGYDRFLESLQHENPQSLAEIFRRGMDAFNMPRFDGSDRELVDTLVTESSNYCDAVRRIKQRGAVPMT